MEYYIAIKIDKVQLYEATQMKLTNIMLSRRNTKGCVLHNSISFKMYVYVKTCKFILFRDEYISVKIE